MVTIIIYDIKAGPEYNKIKRNFYYHLKKLNTKPINKSVVVVDENEATALIELLKKFEEHIDAYVVQAESIERLFR